MLSETDTQAARSPASLPQATAPIFVAKPTVREVSYSKKLLLKKKKSGCKLLPFPKLSATPVLCPA